MMVVSLVGVRVLVMSFFSVSTAIQHSDPFEPNASLKYKDFALQKFF